MSAMGRKRTFCGGWLPKAAGEIYRYPAKHEVRPQQLPLRNADMAKCPGPNRT
jgi:hypothetical protein